MIVKEQKSVDRLLLASHSIIAGMQGEIGSFFSLIGLVSYAKKKSKK